jgi:hypothetical protein
MAASEHLHPELFHGTGHFFGEGEMIQPTWRGFNPSKLDDRTPLVFMSSSRIVAEGFAAAGAQQNEQLFGPIYSVEPSKYTKNVAKDRVKNDYPYAESPDTYALETYTSSTPVKPKEIVGWGVNRFSPSPELNRPNPNSPKRFSIKND